jgi:diguanylate cyclase (GGDEF)-like protein/PAS domain S-box-containing protein
VPPGLRRLTDDECRSIAEGTEELIVMFETDGTIRYVNEVVMAVLGGAAEDYLGHNVVDFVHPDELERGLQVLAFTSEFGTIPGTTSFRLRTTDGGHVQVELTSGSIDADVPARFVLGRVASHHIALLDTLHSLAGNDDVAVALRAALDTLGWRRVDSHIAVAWRDADGNDRAVTTGLPNELTGADADPGSVWDEVRRTGRAANSPDLDSLDPRSRALAEASGLGGYWIEPLEGPGAPALLSVWTRAGGLPPALHAQGMELAAELIGVILRWDDQQRRLDDAATHDALTGLANRRLFFDALAAAGPGVVLYCDLDRFKPVNDEFGHAVGDALLQVVAERLRASVREGDLVARVGGDEFAVLCPGATLEEAGQIADRLARSVAQPADVMGTRVQVGITIGSAHEATRLDEAAVEAADRQLYEHKAARGTPPV